MNGIAGFIGWLVIWCALVVVVAVPLGKSLKFLGRDMPGPEPQHRNLSTRPPFGGYTDPDTAPHQSRYALPESRFDDGDLNNPSLRDTPEPPSSPAS